MKNPEIDTLDIVHSGGAMALNINGIDFGVDVAHIEILKHLCITALQEVDDERMYNNEAFTHQWEHQEDEEPNPYHGTYSEM